MVKGMEKERRGLGAREGGRHVSSDRDGLCVDRDYARVTGPLHADISRHARPGSTLPSTSQKPRLHGPTPSIVTASRCAAASTDRRCVDNYNDNERK